MADLGGSLWAIITIGFVALLAVGLAYGTWMWRSAPRDPDTLRRKDEATRRNCSDEAVEEAPLLPDSGQKETKRRRRA